MLEPCETAILQEMLAASPNPSAQYLFTFADEDAAALERLSYIGLIEHRGWNPVQYALTPAGRHYDRDTAEREAVQRAAKKLERREKLFYLVVGAVVGAVITKLVDFLYQLILNGVSSLPRQ